MQPDPPETSLPPAKPIFESKTAVAGLLTVGLMSAMNFALHSDFRWLLLVPVLLWLGGLVSYLREDAAGTAATAK